MRIDIVSISTIQKRVQYNNHMKNGNQNLKTGNHPHSSQVPSVNVSSFNKQQSNLLKKENFPVINEVEHEESGR